MFKLKNYKKIILLFILVLAVPGSFSSAETVKELQDKINDRNEQIKKINEEIVQHEKDIQKVGAEAQTLQGAIKTLDINQQKVGAEIKKTQVSIDKTNLSISQLGQEISIIEKKVDVNTDAIGRSLSDINKTDDLSQIEILLGNKTLAEVWDEYESNQTFQEDVAKKSEELNEYKKELQGKKQESESKKKELTNLKGELGDQNTILANNKKEKNTLLTQTKNKEAEYKKLLANKQAQKEQFEKELFKFESDLKIAIDPKSFPTGKTGIVSWPLDSIFVTQAFGKTVDSKRLYTLGTHNGVDFRASRGTPVKSVLTGTVQATGNTDSQAGCYSYGKWVLIKHDNGLTSLYAHLDLIKVSSGQAVETGEVIGYSGQTGYATGPHLHFTMYASQGVRVQQYSSSINCKNVSIPVAQADAYLDPMLYLPKL